ncbi:MAG: DUF1211 domain-containing protein [Acidobacteria bacterium]|nr:MAG: DUF1211 domain-containing protein [Acidobacteriota bacterium]
MKTETTRVEAFSDGVFAIAITLLILEIKVPREDAAGPLAAQLMRLWPSYLAFLVSFANIGVMWVNHHRLFGLIRRSDDGLVGLNLLLLLGVTFVPFPTAVLAEHLLGHEQRTAGLLYAGTFVALAIVFNLLWRHVVRQALCAEHADVASISRQYALGPVLYAATAAVAWYSATACLVASGLLAVYFALPPRWWRSD